MTAICMAMRLSEKPWSVWHAMCQRVDRQPDLCNFTMQGVLIIFHAMTWRVLLSVLLLIACGFAQQNKPTSAEVQVVHHAVMIDGAKYDAIITRPASSGRHPAVFLIGGLGCYSLADTQPGEPYYELLHG